MIKLFGASPGVGALAGIVLLAVGLATGRYLLAAAGGFVLLGTGLRWMTSR